MRPDQTVCTAVSLQRAVPWRDAAVLLCDRWCVWLLMWSADVTVHDGNSGDGVGTPLARLTGIQGRSLRVSSLTGVVPLVILYLCVRRLCRTAVTQ